MGEVDAGIFWRMMFLWSCAGLLFTQLPGMGKIWSLHDHDSLIKVFIGGPIVWLLAVIMWICR
jgi:hypothetical protein